MIKLNEDKTKNIALIVIAALTFTAVLVYVIARTPSAKEIFEKVANGVVELKCEDAESAQAFGTAVLTDENWTFATNAHIVTHTRLGQPTTFGAFYIRFSFEEEYREAELIKCDTDADLALLRIKDPPKFKPEPIKIGSDKIYSGDTVYAVGNSQNYGISISRGIVGIPLVKIEYENTVRSVIQCDLTITEGNSGGALLDERGRLIGITTFRTKDGAGRVNYGIAYCIPIGDVKSFLNGE
ncbi:MAG: serine protease [Clostridiales bacterium]|jgi:S1-C subfamily serine protease|nr:serine protease [Clostridiales bacterium]